MVAVRTSGGQGSWMDGEGDAHMEDGRAGRWEGGSGSEMSGWVERWDVLPLSTTTTAGKRPVVPLPPSLAGPAAPAGPREEDPERPKTPQSRCLCPTSF